MKVAVLGTGNVGVAIATDLSIKGHEVSLVKTSDSKSVAYDRLLENDHRVFLKEKGTYLETYIQSITRDLSSIEYSDVIFVTIQSIYHEELIKQMAKYLNCNQIVVCICSYLSSFYFKKYCKELPMIAETTGPYLEGRTELEDKEGEVVFRVGCRLTKSPLSVFDTRRERECMDKIRSLFGGFSNDYTPIESALLNPNLVLHTVGSIMSLPRIEFSNGDFCMYREAYSRRNYSTINVMLKLDEEKQDVLSKLHSKPVDIFVAGGFSKKLKSFYAYSESSDRAKSPTSIRSRYITEDVSQGLVLLESIAKFVGVKTPITTALIDLASASLDEDFRANGRTMSRLVAKGYIEALCG